MNHDREKRGLVLVFTGNGKGKTTAALGMALRAQGYGLKILIIQFMKSGNTGEYRAIKQYLPIEIETFGLSEFVTSAQPCPRDMDWVERGMERAFRAVTSLAHDMVILDEINVMVKYGLVSVDEVVRLITGKRFGLHLVLTGRYAHPRILELADTVSEVQEIKHHLRKGIKAREGLEF